MKPCIILALLIATSPLHAAIIPTSSFLDFPQGQFAPMPNPFSSLLLPITANGVTFSFSPSGPNNNHQIGSSFSFTVGGGADPSGRNFFGPLGGGTSPTIIDFSTPLSAFGVTFHFNQATLSIYSGPNGTGTILGSIVGTPPPPTWSASNRPVDFVGFVLTEGTIGSAVVSGPYQVSGIGFALPVPEPSAFVMAAIGLAGLIGMGRRARLKPFQRSAR